jgi:hypothetical protein
MSLTELMRALDQLGAAAWWSTRTTQCGVGDIDSAEDVERRCCEYASSCGARPAQIQDAVGYGRRLALGGQPAPLHARPHTSFAT